MMCRKLLIVVADGEHARFIRLSPDHALHSEILFDPVSAHKRSAELCADRPGASFHTGSVAHHALAPKHDPRAMEKERFVRLIAKELNAAAARELFDELVIAAPARVLSEIRMHLDHPTEARIVGMRKKDLIKVPDDQLATHLAPWVPRVHRETE